MKVLFITAGPLAWASSRMRAHWPAQYMDGAEVLTYGEVDERDLDLSPYDATIWLKSAHLPVMQALREAGKQVWLDFCDPLHWWNPRETRAILDVSTGVVCSNEALLVNLREWYAPAETRFNVIPDRLELSHFPHQRQHEHTTPVRLIWFGLYVNRIGLLSAMPNLERLACNGYEIALTVMDERPDQVMQSKFLTVYHVPWSLERENEIIASHDIAVLPPYPGPWGAVKSNNKAVTAWACGVPAVDGLDYSVLEWIYTTGNRIEAADAGHAIVTRDYTAEQSARDWMELLHV